MKINIISFHNHHSLTADVEVVSYCLRKFYKNKKIFFNFFNFQETRGQVADVNIFLSVCNNFFIKYAPINILIIDPHKFDEAWIPYLPKFNHILGKTDFSVSLLREKIPNLKNIGWKTLDCYENIEKNYDSFLCICGLSRFRQLSTILELWKPEYPKLHILCGKNYLKNFEIEKKEQDNITYQEEYLPQPKFLQLINSYGIHLCLGSASSFSNTLQNCLSAKSIPIAMDNVLNKKFISHHVSGFLVKCRKKKKLKNNYGSEYLIDSNSFQETIEKIISLDEIKLEEIAEKGKKDFRVADREFEKNFKELFDGVWNNHKTQKPLNPLYQKFDEDLPSVSIITPTLERKQFFSLAIRNFQKMDYPREKVEWIIVEDGISNDSVVDLLPKQDNIRYFRIEDNLTIGEKRNYAVEKANHDIIVCMDDDDYYQPGSVKYRVACLEHLQKEVIACTSMGILDINKIISNMTVSSFIQEYYTRAYESSMAFRKSFWKDNKFSHENVHEGKGLLEGNLDKYEEVPYNPIMISLKHYGNTNDRLKVNGETNGCHFNFSDELFELITSLDEQDDGIDVKQLNKSIPQNKSVNTQEGNNEDSAVKKESVTTPEGNNEESAVKKESVDIPEGTENQTEVKAETN